MGRVYESFAYGPRPIRDSFWHATAPEIPVYPELSAETPAEFAVVGGGLTGVAAALTLTEAGADVVVLDAERPGWGASGRAGGLVSVGSSKLSDDVLRRRYGAQAAQAFFDAERAAVDHLSALVERLELDVDRHSDGYTFVAHSKTAIPDVRAYGESYRERYGLDYRFLDRDEMAAEGLASPEFHAAAHVPVGFAVNPIKLVLGLTRAAEAAGVRFFSNSPVTRIDNDGRHVLVTPAGRVRARHVIFATNGYGRDDVPEGLRGRFLPVQSNILVTRPLSDDEIAAQGWWSDQMVVDSRNLLHYLRLLPDRRMLFGLRGSLFAGDGAMARTRAAARADFERIFPAWAEVETPFFWSGFIAMTRALVPFAGRVPGMERAFAAFGYHGSGVAMAPYAGTLVAELAMGRPRRPHPEILQTAPGRFPLGRWRRLALAPAFAWYKLRDRG